VCCIVAATCVVAGVGGSVGRHGVGRRKVTGTNPTGWEGVAPQKCLYRQSDGCVVGRQYVYMLQAGRRRYRQSGERCEGNVNTAGERYMKLQANPVKTGVLQAWRRCRQAVR